MPNPFFFAGKITHPDHFVGREEEFKKIFACLDTTHTGQIQHVSVVGQRRIGKSSLLYHVGQIYQDRLTGHENYRFVYLDLDDPNCHTLLGLLQCILKDLKLSAPAEPTLAEFYNLIKQEHEDKKIWPVFLMDEFEHLPQREKEFTDLFYDALRSLGNNNIVGLVTASQSTLQDLASQKKLTSPLLNIFHQMDLKEFSDKDVNIFLNRGRTCDRPFSDDDCVQILKIAGKFPARLQIVGSLVYEAKANQQSLDWKTIKAEAIKQSPFVNGNETQKPKFGWLWNALKWLFISLPIITGRTFLETIGRDKASDTSAWIWGVIILAIIVSLIVGFINWTDITSIWRDFRGEKVK
jgi:uncharacterized protein